MTNDLYQEKLMDLYRNPTHRGKMAAPTKSVDKQNPMCGDEVRLQLKLKDGVIEDIKFEGSACAVSVIASEVLAEQVIGKAVAEIEQLDKETFLSRLGLNLTTSRVKCATLALNALKDALGIAYVQ